MDAKNNCDADYSRWEGRAGGWRLKHGVPGRFGFGVELPGGSANKLGWQASAATPTDSGAPILYRGAGNSAAMGYARRSGIPLDAGFVRNHYVGRTFIMPGHDLRASGVRIKLNVVRDVVRGKRVVVVDDSIVRGTTSRARMATLRDAGAREVHLRISAPPIRCPCYYGIDFQHADELIAADHSVEEIRRFVGVDSLGYQTVEGLLSAVPGGGDGYCCACFTGGYPVEAEEGMDKHSLERQRGGVSG
jgi:amidophosphoribosyltransferase